MNAWGTGVIGPRAASGDADSGDNRETAVNDRMTAFAGRAQCTSRSRCVQNAAGASSRNSYRRFPDGEIQIECRSSPDGGDPVLRLRAARPSDGPRTSEITSVAPLIATAIRRNHRDESLPTCACLREQEILP